MGQPDLTANIGAITLKNPVMIASGTCGYGLELDEWEDITQLGGVVLKGLSLEPRTGNPPPRIVETPAGLLNSIGLENIGVRRFIKDVLPILKQYRAILIANVYATTVDDFVRVACLVEEAGGITALELNLSCPNVRSGGIAFGQDPKLAAAVVSAVKQRTNIPLIVKMTPKVTDIAQGAKACQDAGADALSITNTFPGMAVDIRSRRPVLGGNFGGVSGPAIKPMALKLVWEACQAVSLPVIGMGGIMTWQDALEFIIVGAAAIQIGTATLVDPQAGLKILNGISDFIEQEDLISIESIRGSLRLHNN